jgi:hypothetical protein
MSESALTAIVFSRQMSQHLPTLDGQTMTHHRPMLSERQRMLFPGSPWGTTFDHLRQGADYSPIG